MTTRNHPYFLSVLILLALFDPGILPDLPDGPSAAGAVHLAPVWTTGIISERSEADYVVSDIDMDGKPDLIGCGSGYAHAVNYLGEGQYGVAWLSEYLLCYKIVTADRDADGIQELFVVTVDGNVLILHGVTHKLIATLRPNLAAGIQDMAVGNVDNDRWPEIVIAAYYDILVYDSITLRLDWQAPADQSRQVKVGNIDADPLGEIVANGATGKVLDAAHKREKWSRAGGFGVDMELGDVDGDRRAEIAFLDGGGVPVVLDGETRQEKWRQTGYGGTNYLSMFDLDGDGASDVIGTNLWGSSAYGFRGNDGALLWLSENNYFGYFGMIGGELDDEPLPELAWSGTLGGSLMVRSWITDTVGWQSPDLEGPLYVAAGDVDLDGKEEMIVASYATNNRYSGGAVEVYDGATHRLEWADYGNGAAFSQVLVGQLDSDEQLEILAAADAMGPAAFFTYDAVKQKREWSSPLLGGGSSYTVLVKNIDDDAVDEIIAGLTNRRIVVLNGATPMVQWESPVLDGVVMDVAVGDLDGDGALELAALTTQSVYIFSVGTWTQTDRVPVTNGRFLAIGNADHASAGELLLLTEVPNPFDLMPPLQFTLHLWDGANMQERWQRSLGADTILEFNLADIDGDGYDEMLFAGTTGVPPESPSSLRIARYGQSDFWAYQLVGRWGKINDLAVADVDADGRREVLFAAEHLVQINEVLPGRLYRPYTERR
jgi:hypothetical protein